MTKFGEQKCLFRHPVGTGSAPRATSIIVFAVSIDLTAISINLAVSYDEEGLVLPRG
jgi:hypothetical protein